MLSHRAAIGGISPPFINDLAAATKPVFAHRQAGLPAGAFGLRMDLIE
jgi:hypothetical protein